MHFLAHCLFHTFSALTTVYPVIAHHSLNPFTVRKHTECRLPCGQLLVRSFQWSRRPVQWYSCTSSRGSDYSMGKLSVVPAGGEGGEFPISMQSPLTWHLTSQPRKWALCSQTDVPTARTPTWSLSAEGSAPHFTEGTEAISGKLPRRKGPSTGKPPQLLRSDSGRLSPLLLCQSIWFLIGLLWYNWHIINCTYLNYDHLSIHLYIFKSSYNMLWEFVPGLPPPLPRFWKCFVWKELSPLYESVASKPHTTSGMIWAMSRLSIISNTMKTL